jgi:hypothetical protein
MINKDSANSKPSVSKMAKIRRHGIWSSYQLHTRESAPERQNLKVYTSDDSTVFWTCIYKMKPGCRLHTNGKNYIYKSILVKRGNGVKRELHPVHDPLDPFLTQKADKNPPNLANKATSKTSFEKPTCNMPNSYGNKDMQIQVLQNRLLFLRKNIIFKERKFLVFCSTIKNLRDQLKHKQRLVQNAKRAHANFSREYKNVKDKSAQEIEKLTKENTYLQTRLTKLADMIENIYDLEKQKILTKGYQKGLTKLSQQIRNLEAEKDFQHIEYCLRTFDTFCNNSICPAAQTLSISGSQLAKAMGLLSITIFPLSYVSNQLCRFIWKQTGTETAATCSD